MIGGRATDVRQWHKLDLCLRLTQIGLPSAYSQAIAHFEGL